MPSWDVDQYLRFAAERARPFEDLVARVAAAHPGPRRVVDLGCGPGTATATLADRWPSAQVLGVDSSPAMVEAASRLAGPRLRFETADARDFVPADRPDVLVANAVLQWVPGHLALLPRWLDALASDGVLAFQVPANHDSAWVAVLDGVVTSPRWRERFATVERAPGQTDIVPTLDTYVGTLGAAGCTVDAWETTYHHVLPGEDPVLEWFAGTGLRPYTDALLGDDAALAAFRGALADQLRAAYPPRDYGTVLPFHRLFVVAHR